MLFALATADTWSIIGALCSVFSVLLAIWQPWAREAKRTADDARERFDRVETLIAGAYSDAFGLTRDLVDDMRAHAWSISEQELGRDTRMRMLGASQEAIRSRLIGAIYSARSQGLATIAADDLLGPLFDEFHAEEVHAALADLRREGVVDWRRAGDWVEEPNVPISLLSSDGSQRWLAAA
ncbi:MAG TPA: hypothetical protein VHW67_09790 [Solirubrobacteraceae bacterium]|jgi:hypothetical protein|nr:hypothetical protein [Solirubrobacteraceae bacterium]